MISVTILVKNGARHLKEVLKALSNFPEVVVVDTGSTDSSCSITEEFTNVALYHHPFEGFGPSHNRAAAVAKYEWILSLDADEVLSSELAREILSLSLDENCVYSLPFLNYFNGKLIRWCGWYPENHIRLYHKKSTRFSQALVHEKVISQGLSVVSLKNPVHHFSYNSLSDFLQKMERYSTLFAQQSFGKKKSSPWIALYHGVGAFLKSYFLKRGFIGGYEGFLISIYNGHTAFYKYLKLYEAHARSSLPQDWDRKAL